MSERDSWSWRALGVLLLVLPAATLAAADEDEPTYKGKPAGYWMEKLRDPDSAVRRQAVVGLVAIGPRADKVVPALLKALEDDSDPVREAALTALGQMGPAAKAAVPAIVEVLQDRDPAYRKTAITALGGIGPAAEAAVPALVRLVSEKKDDPNLRSSVILALGQIGPAAKKALPDLEKHVNLSLTVQEVEALGKMGPEAAPLVARSAAGGSVSNPGHRAAAHVLVRWGPEGVKKLAALLGDSDAGRRQVAAGAFEKLGIAVKGPTLGWANNPEQRTLRSWYEETIPAPEQAAFEAACRNALPALGKALRDKDNLVRVRAANALGAFREAPPGAIDELIQMLLNQQTETAARGALAGIGADAVPELLKPAWQDDPKLGPKVREALVRVRPLDVKAVPALFQVWRDKDTQGRGVALQAVSALASIGPEVVPPVMAHLKGEDRTQLAFGVLEQLGPKAKDAVPGLTAFLEDKDPFYRVGAVRVLGAIGPAAKEAVFQLTKIAEEERDPALRSAAAQALKKIR